MPSSLATPATPVSWLVEEFGGATSSRATTPSPRPVSPKRSASAPNSARVRPNSGAALRQFRAELLRREGTFAAGWRRILDSSATGFVTHAEFCEACRRMNYRGNIRDAWHELDADGSGKATICELDWPTAEALGKFTTALASRFGGVDQAAKSWGLRGGRRLRKEEFRSLVSGILEAREADSIFRMICCHDTLARPSVRAEDLRWLQQLSPSLPRVAANRVEPGMLAAEQLNELAFQTPGEVPSEAVGEPSGPVAPLEPGETSPRTPRTPRSASQPLTKRQEPGDEGFMRLTREDLYNRLYREAKDFHKRKQEKHEKEGLFKKPEPNLSAAQTGSTAYFKRLYNKGLLQKAQQEERRQRLEREADEHFRKPRQPRRDVPSWLHKANPELSAKLQEPVWTRLQKPREPKKEEPTPVATPRHLTVESVSTAACRADVAAAAADRLYSQAQKRKERQRKKKDAEDGLQAIKEKKEKEVKLTKERQNDLVLRLHNYGQEKQKEAMEKREEARKAAEEEVRQLADRRRGKSNKVRPETFFRLHLESWPTSISRYIGQDTVEDCCCSSFLSFCLELKSQTPALNIAALLRGWVAEAQRRHVREEALAERRKMKEMEEVGKTLEAEEAEAEAASDEGSEHFDTEVEQANLDLSAWKLSQGPRSPDDGGGEDGPDPRSREPSDRRKSNEEDRASTLQELREVRRSRLAMHDWMETQKRELKAGDDRFRTPPGASIAPAERPADSPSLEGGPEGDERALQALLQRRPGSVPGGKRRSVAATLLSKELFGSDDEKDEPLPSQSSHDADPFWGAVSDIVSWKRKAANHLPLENAEDVMGKRDVTQHRDSLRILIYKSWMTRIPDPSFKDLQQQILHGGDEMSEAEMRKRACLVNARQRGCPEAQCGLPAGLLVWLIFNRLPNVKLLAREWFTGRKRSVFCRPECTTTPWVVCQLDVASLSTHLQWYGEGLRAYAQLPCAGATLANQTIQREVAVPFAGVQIKDPGMQKSSGEIPCRARVDGLQPGTRYSFVLAATNALGTGCWSTLSTPLATPPAAPAPPVSAVATVSVDAEQQVVVTVSWECCEEPGSGALAAFEVQLVPAELQHVRPASDRRLLCERIAAQNMRAGQRICWAKALAAPGYYLVEVTAENIAGQRSAAAVLTLEVRPEVFPPSIAELIPPVPSWSEESLLVLGPAASSAQRFADLDSSTWLQTLLLWRDRDTPAQARGVQRLSSGTLPSSIDVLCFFRRPGSGQVFRAVLAAQVTTSRLQVALPPHVPMSLRLAVNIDPTVAAHVSGGQVMSEPLVVLMSEDGERLRPTWEIWSRPATAARQAPRWTSLPQELIESIEAAWLEGHPKVALQLPHALEGGMPEGSYELTFGDERQTQSLVRKLGPGGWTAKARRVVLDSEGEDQAAPSAPAEELCVVCLERKRTQPHRARFPLEGENVSNLPPRLQRFAASPAHTGHVLTWPGTEVATVLSHCLLHDLDLLRDTVIAMKDSLLQPIQQGSVGVHAGGVLAGLCMTKRLRQAGDRTKDRRRPIVTASDHPGNANQNLCGMPELPTRAEFIQKHVHQSLHSEIYHLSDLELNSLGKHPFADQGTLIDRLKGSEALGARCFCMSREQFVQKKICDDLRKAVSSFSDQELLNLSREDRHSKQVIDYWDSEQQNSRPAAVALGPLKTSRNKYIEKCIHSDLRDQLSALSDGALFVLGSPMVGRQNQPDRLAAISRADKLLPYSRSLWLSNVSKDPEVRQRLTELGKLTDFEIYHLGRGKKQNINKYRERLNAQEATTEKTPVGDADQGKPDRAVQDGSILAGIRDALEAEEEEDGPVVVAVQEDVEERLTGNWAKSLQGRAVGVAVSGQLLRNGHLKYIAICADSDVEPLVVDVESLSEKRPTEALFSELLLPLKEVLENRNIVKVCHDCRPLADLLFEYDVQLEACFDTVEEMARTYDHELENALRERAVLQKPKTPRAYDIMVQEAGSSSEAESAWSPELLAEVAEALVKISEEMSGALANQASQFRDACQARTEEQSTKSLQEFRSWPGQHLGAYPPGCELEFCFVNGKLCIVGSADQNEADVNTVSGGSSDNDEEFEKLITLLPEAQLKKVREFINGLDGSSNVVEIVLGVGRDIEIRWRALLEGGLRKAAIANTPISREHIDEIVCDRIGEDRFNQQNRAGIDRTLHRISVNRNENGYPVTVTMRVGRSSRMLASVIEDIIQDGSSFLLLSPPGVGKTTLLRACAGDLSSDQVVVIVDPSGEIAGSGDTCHPAVGEAWKDAAHSAEKVDRSEARRLAMGRALENMGPQVIVVDEIGTLGEARAARTIGERGVQLVATAHGRTLRDLVANSELRDLIGGLKSATLGDNNERYQSEGRKNITERGGKPVFKRLVEIRSPNCLVVHHDLAYAVDQLLKKGKLLVEERTLNASGEMMVKVRNF
ncbi:ycf45 [Symbiodinium necroappetens]|uniref:Ycf45 protein n=1 Tax=Symbiodinium necroappetens TaxID=1628268 RepID=A0A812XFZ5_9DINO|nr:ycf45 [Symbiodinium necroappetens]